MRNTKYTTQLAQGAGLINETLLLLSVFHEGMSIEDLTNYARNNDLLSCKTDSRLKHITKDVFYMRFMKENPHIPIWLKTLRSNGMPLKPFMQLLMVYCAREHAVMFDTITNILNPLKLENKQVLDKNLIISFIKDINNNNMAKWSDTMQHKNAGYIFSTLADFDIINRKGEILPYELYDSTILYLLHEQHFAGLSDMALWEMEEWDLFNLNRRQILDRIMNLSLKGAYMAQTSGELLTISWNYQSMEEFIDATL